MTPAVRLAVEPGTGRLARTPHGILFAPANADALTGLVDAFVAADGPAAIDAVTQEVVAAGFDVPAFTCITWHDRVVVLVFGDVQVRTDHPALPMLSGAASETWVEHTLRAGPDTVTLHVDGPAQDDTDLRDGIVPAGGFRVSVTTGPATSTTASVPAAPASPPPVEPVTEPLAAPAVDTDDPESSLAAIQAAAVTSDLPVATPAPTPPLPTAPPPPTAPPSTAPPAPDAPPVPNGALVEAVTCPAGHLDRPGSTACRVCGEAIPADALVATHARPPMGTLVVEGGGSHHLDGDVVLGRRPTAPEGSAALTVPGEKASRTHAEVTVRGWDVYVRDLGSTNGTHLVAREGDEPFTLAPDVPTRILPGAVVYVGSTAVTFAPPDP